MRLFSEWSTFFFPQRRIQSKQNKGLPPSTLTRPRSNRMCADFSEMDLFAAISLKEKKSTYTNEVFFLFFQKKKNINRNLFKPLHCIFISVNSDVVLGFFVKLNELIHPLPHQPGHLFLQVNTHTGDNDNIYTCHWPQRTKSTSHYRGCHFVLLEHMLVTVFVSEFKCEKWPSLNRPHK